MRWSWTGQVVDLVTRLGAAPVETEDERVRRLIWVTTLLLAAPISFLTAFAFRGLDSLPAATLMLAGAACWAGQLLLFAALRRGLDTFALASQLSCVALSFAGVLAMGGPVRSGGFVLLGLIGPLYALAFPNRRRAVWVFVAYLASIGAGVALSGRLPWAQPLRPAVNLTFFGLMLTIVAAFVFETFSFFVRERDLALRRLREVEDKLSRLLESSPGASDTIPGWSRSMAREIADAIGADAIGIWELAATGLLPLADEHLAAPSAEAMRNLAAAAGGSFVHTPGATAVAVAGPSGELCGMLVVAGGAVRWTQSERRLVTGFAHQLGAALDVKRMRAQLAAGDERRALTRQEMQARGIATLQVCPQCGRCYDHAARVCSVDGSGLDAPRTLPYRLLDRYRFVRLLGEGGMGTVLAAWDEKLERDVAVKLIRPEHFNNADLRERFEREARTVARIQHPGVVALYDSGELEDESAFLVMEMLTGRDLGCQLKTHGRGTPAQVAELVRQGCAALRAAHRAGVVHRDVKPENIFLVDVPGGFRVKILDFGLAKSTTFDRGLTQAGMVMGTPAYMSPEQVQGEDVDARTDVYSFAAVCYEALTGVKAVANADLGQVLISVLNTVPASPSSLVPGLPPEVDAAFESALAKDRARRLKEIELWGSSFVESLARVAAGPATQGWPDALTPSAPDSDTTRLSA
jgi:hypothetical protein